MWRVFVNNQGDWKGRAARITGLGLAAQGAVLAAGIVVVPVVALAVLVGLFVGVVVFVALSLVVAVVTAVGGIFSGGRGDRVGGGGYQSPAEDGRENVRVIVHEQRGE
ncbi:MAG: hypothetical protein K8S99_05615 [Planctomycetes bacterium]|nr:hypothetical protein [Planctomycetota bacterium]